MVLQTSGAISLADIAAEFGGSAPHSLSEYYGAASGVPASGAISIGTFYGKSAAQTVTLNTDEKEMNLRTKAVALGWNGSSALIFVINTGKYVWSDNVTVAALTTGTNFPNGLTIVNKGYIMGRGGNANHSSNAGQAGGPAIALNVSVTIDNSNGYIGGGGGGAAGNFGGAGAGGGKNLYSQTYTAASGNESTSASYTLAAANNTTGLGSVSLTRVGSSHSETYHYTAMRHHLHSSEGGGHGGISDVADFFL